ncbi:TetR/AcrR family transcriptional regulator [Kribbella pittospori]|nr:TetR/AcrR family transcriptional regulator [Kribbella pittospori]
MAEAATGTEYEDPRIRRSRAMITEAAAAEFLAKGYQGTSIDDIAATAGVAKRTVYNIYGDKEQVFRAMITAAIATAESYSERLGTSGLTDRRTRSEAPLEERLVDIARDLAQAIHGGPVIRLRRLVIGEAERFPDVAIEYYRRAPQLVMTRLAQALAELDAAGHLAVPDPELAAEHLAFLAIGASLDRAMFDSDLQLDAALTRAEAGARAFYRAYRR